MCTPEINNLDPNFGRKGRLVSGSDGHGNETVDLELLDPPIGYVRAFESRSSEHGEYVRYKYTI